MFSYGFVVQIPDMPEMDDAANKMIGNAVTKAINMMFQAIQKENLRGNLRAEAAFTGVDEVVDTGEKVPARLMIRLDAPQRGSIITM